jgi:hypothetical protein
MQGLDVPAGPSRLLVERVRCTIGAGSTSYGSRHTIWRWAAIVLLAASVGAAWFAMHRGGNQQLADPSPPVPVAPQPDEPRPVMLTGLVRIEGSPPIVPPPLMKLPGPGCPHHHAPPPDESLQVAAGGGLANVVVSVSTGLPDDSEYPKPAAAAVLDQKDCRYFPHVVTMQVGQELLAKNSDPFLHSVHTNPLANVPVNIAQYKVDPVGTRLKSIKSAETFKVTCDLHPWMTAWVAAFDHPFFAVTKSDGSFAMPYLPPGTYTLKAWHERLGSVEQQVTVTYDGKLPPVQFKYGPDRVAAAYADRAPMANAGEAAVVGKACCAKAQ